MQSIPTKTISRFNLPPADSKEIICMPVMCDGQTARNNLTIRLTGFILGD
jgi:hypothetical protein